MSGLYLAFTLDLAQFLHNTARFMDWREFHPSFVKAKNEWTTQLFQCLELA